LLEIIDEHGAPLAEATTRAIRRTHYGRPSATPGAQHTPAHRPTARVESSTLAGAGRRGGLPDRAPTRSLVRPARRPPRITDVQPARRVGRRGRRVRAGRIRGSGFSMPTTPESMIAAKSRAMAGSRLVAPRPALGVPRHRDAHASAASSATARNHVPSRARETGCAAVARCGSHATVRRPAPLAKPATGYEGSGHQLAPQRS